MSLPCTTQRKQQSQSKSKLHRTEVNIMIVFLWLVEQDWCETIWEEVWGSTSLGRGGAFSDMKEQFQWKNTWMSVRPPR